MTLGKVDRHEGEVGRKGKEGVGQSWNKDMIVSYLFQMKDGERPFEVGNKTAGAEKN